LQPLLDFLERFGYAFLFLNVFAEQPGLPIPGVPILLCMGALAGQERASMGVALAIASVAALLGDVIWYELGRRRGHSILNFLCRVSLEPESCVSDTKPAWERHGARTFPFAKFAPGWNTAAPPLAGLARMRPGRFAALDFAGRVVWAAAFLRLGWLFHHELEAVAQEIARFGTSLSVFVFAPPAVRVVWKYEHRRRFLRDLRVARIAPEELRETIERGEDVVVVDPRRHSGVSADGLGIPGARRIDSRVLEEEEALPRDGELAFYRCWPNEASSARAALLLMRRGALRARPPAGGIEQWRKLGYPLAPIR
jgi:membrane protein DedA with SNARE-associated domain/rhodanese-related sulfurtransferase